MATLSIKPKDRIPDGFTDVVRANGKDVDSLFQSMPEEEFRAIQLRVRERTRRLLQAFPGGDPDARRG